MNTMRVFLHNLLWENDPEGLKKRINEFLAIADKPKIKIMFVLFDSVWDPNPVYGLQSQPIPGVHNSRWVKAPGDRKSVVEGKSGTVRVDLGGRGIIKKKKIQISTNQIDTI